MKYFLNCGKDRHRHFNMCYNHITMMLHAKYILQIEYIPYINKIIIYLQ